MGNINPTYFNRVKYELYNPQQGTLETVEPIGWKTDDKEYSRHKEYLGLVTKFSNNLKFFGNGADFILLIDELYGINAEIKLTKYEKHPHTDAWTVVYTGYLDLSTIEEEDNQVSIKFNSGGLEQALKAREGEPVEIDRITTIDGMPMQPLVPNKVILEGRRIFLKTSWDIKRGNDYASTYVQSNDGNTRHSTVGIPFDLVNKSHENAHSVLIESQANENGGSTGMMFYAVSDRVRVLNIRLNLTFKLTMHQEDVEWAFYNINLARYADGIEYDPVQRISLFSLPTKWDIFNANGNTFSFSYEGQITVNVGESLAIEGLLKSDLGGPGFADLRVKLIDIKGEMFMDEDSFYEQSECNFILAHELADRLITINSNKENSLYSEFLGRTDIGYSKDGQASLTGNTHGFWVRGFEIDPDDEENRFKPLTTSFKDFMTSYSAVWKLGMGIETVNRKERVRLEELSFFFNFNVTIKLPNQIKKAKRSKATDYFFSGLEFGYDEGGSYEEAMGLDEYNAKSKFTTIINRVKNTFTQISKYRADSYGKEFARRKPKSNFSTEDTSYDNSIFIMDLKRDIDGLFKERKWQDDFQEAPTGTYSPETATNLRFSPFNCMLRHSWDFAAGLIKYPIDYVRYGSSTANSALKTKLRVDPDYVSQPTSTPGNGNAYAENGNILNSELRRPRFKPEWLEFEHVCDFEVMQQVEGNTTILGKEIPNFYGLVEFTNEKNKTEKGFLFNLKPNGQGSWKVLTANR